QFHDTAKLSLLLPEEIESREEELFQEAKRLMPALPFAEIDLLIVDRLGKNISGSGMDPNIIGRGVHGYESQLAKEKAEGREKREVERPKNAGTPSSISPLLSHTNPPRIRRIFVRDLTPETHGNAIGIGMADMTTTRLVRAMNERVTFINALTSLAVHSAKIPMHFDTDREAIGHALNSLALPDPRQAKIVRIADTLSLERLEVSEAYAELIRQDPQLESLSVAEQTKFGADENLLPTIAAH